MNTVIPTADLEDFHHYLPLPEALVHGSLYLTSAGRSTILPNECYPKQPHPPLYHFSWNDGRTLPDFVLLLVTEGLGTFQSRETGRIRLRAGQALFLFPGIWHRYRPDGESGWTEKWIQFDGPFAFQLQKQCVISPFSPVMNPSDFRAAEDLLDGLLDKIHAHPTLNTMHLSLEALSVVASVLKSPTLPLQDESPDLEDSDPIVTAALEYIWTQSRNVLDVPEVTNAVAVTRRTLERHMLAARGHGVLDEIIECRFSRAERLLRSTKLPLKTIVHLSGFGSQENMRQVFVAKTGMSPRAYRGFHNPATV